MINIYEIKIKIKCLSFDFMNKRYVDNMSTHFPTRHIDFLYTEFREFMRLRPKSWCHIKNYKIFIKFINIHYLDKFLKEYIGVLDQQDLYYILSKLNNNAYYTLEELMEKGYLDARVARRIKASYDFIVKQHWDK